MSLEHREDTLAETSGSCRKKSHVPFHDSKCDSTRKELDKCFIKKFHGHVFRSTGEADVSMKYEKEVLNGERYHKLLVIGRGAKTSVKTVFLGSFTQSHCKVYSAPDVSMGVVTNRWHPSVKGCSKTQ